MSDKSEITQSDRLYMSRCIHLAENGLGRTSPNPLVGCVIVHEGKIIGEGYHRKYGEAHAEVNAIQSVADAELLKDSTLYVNLEPCAHQGKTAPCSDLIISKNIPRVVIGTIDPHSIVAGKGIAKLRSAGIEVRSDILREECLKVNKRYFTFYGKKRPYIILKWAQTADGFIDRKRKSGEKSINWITGEDSRRLVHLWRSQEDAILVGANTVRNDNPSLTVREVSGKNPLRLIIDSSLSLQGDYKVFDGEAETVVFNSTLKEKRKNIRYEAIRFDGSELRQVLTYLYEREIQSLIVEGGAFTLEQFIKENLWDEARVFTGAVNFTNGLSAPAFVHRSVRHFTIGNDRCDIYLNPSAESFSE